MKKIINLPENYVNEMLMGIYSAYPDKLRMIEDEPRCLVSVRKKPGKVGITTGGGSGHLPLFLGYVGDGLIDGCSVGEVFQSSQAEHMLAVIREVDTGAGVLNILGNYNGDKLNFKIASDMAEIEHGIRVESVIVADDIALAASGEKDIPSRRRGVAGIFFVYKCAGAAAEEGMNLEGVKNVAVCASENVRTMGVALSACTIPRVGKPGFAIGVDDIEIGMGLHGESGIRIEKMKTADEIVDDILTALLNDLPSVEGEEVAVLINGLGSTPLDELYIMMNHVAKVLKKNNIKLYRSYVGEFATAMEMAGASISLFKLNDELKRLLDAPANSPFFKQF